MHLIVGREGTRHPISTTKMTPKQLYGVLSFHSTPSHAGWLAACATGGHAAELATSAIKSRHTNSLLGKSHNFHP
jgi:hypothetical protein